MIDPTSEPTEQRFADKVYYDVAMNRLEQQLHQIDALDHKFANAFAFSSAVLAGLTAILAIRGEDLEWYSLVLFGLGAAAYMVAVCFAIQAYITKPWSLRPDLETLMSHCGNYDNASMRFWVGDECLRSAKDNEARIQGKLKAGRIAFHAIPFEALFLAAAAVLSLL